MNDQHELLGAYVTDALDPDERTEFEAHLGNCADCRAEETDLREVLAALADAHPVGPPAELEDAVIARVRATTGPAEPGEAPGARNAPSAAEATTGQPGAPAALAPEATVHDLSRRRSWPRAAGWLAAAACGGLLFAAGFGVGQGQSVNAEVATGDDQAMADIVAVAAAPDATVLPVDMMGTTSRVLASDEMGKAAFLASDLPTPAKGMCYQVWRVAADGTKESAGTFTPDADGHVAVVLEGSPDTAGFVITTEPPGGSRAPTGDMVGQVDA